MIRYIMPFPVQGFSVRERFAFRTPQGEEVVRLGPVIKEAEFHDSPFFDSEEAERKLKDYRTREVERAQAERG